MKQLTTGVYVIYSRKSKFTGKGESVENQIELCRQYIAKMYGQVEADTALVYEDEGFSGGNLDRPQFKQMMKDSHKQKFAAIVVYRLDRISRNIGDFAGLIEDLGERNIDFVSIREQFDTSSPMGRAMMYIASVFSQLERETIAERIRDNMHELAKTGRWLGGITPTGFSSVGETTVSVDGKARKAFRLQPIPEEITLIKSIFEVFLETGSLTKVDQYLLTSNAKTRKGGTFTRYTIRNILTNPVYMVADKDTYDYMSANEVDLYSSESEFDGVHGIMAYNRTLQRPHKGNEIKPMNEWIVSVGKHPGIIPGAKWVAVQDKLALNRSKRYRRPRSHVALLSGLLVCGHCGEFMRPKMTSRHTATGEEIYTYMCNLKERSRKKCCEMKNANGNLLDARVVELVKELGQNSNELSTQIEHSKKMIRSEEKNYIAEIEHVKKRLAQIDEQNRALVDSLTRATGLSAEKLILDRIEELNSEAEGGHRRIEEVEAIIKKHQLADMELDLFRQALQQFSDSVDEYNLEQKRVALRSIIKKVIWDGKSAHVIMFTKSGEVDYSGIIGENGEVLACKVPLSGDSE